MLNLYEILKEVLNESVSSESVIDAMDNKYQVIINYSDEKNRAPKKRIIEPYAYGYSKAGNEVFRAYQYSGDSYRGVPKWKLFRLDRVKSWQPTDRHFNVPPHKNGWPAEPYNEFGDETMSVVLNQVSFDDNNDDDYSSYDRLNNLRKKTERLKNSKPINIFQTNDIPNTQNTISNKQDTLLTNPNDNAEFQTMLQRNLERTRKEKERRGFSLSKNKENEPIVNNTIKDTISQPNKSEPIINNDIKNTIDTNTENNNDNAEFQTMLQRNLERTRKEKERRGFSLSNNK